MSLVAGAPGWAVLCAYTLQRVGELALNRRNSARLIARGAQVRPEPWYPLIVLLHAAWLAGLWLLAWDRVLAWTWVAVLAGLQAVRVWTMATLGERWTTQIVVLPGAAPVRTGPYRWLRHPNYAVVAAEVALVPVAFGLTLFALAFTALNAPLLALRMRAEERALDLRRR
ncbi:MAG TPA: isoprenylcysteine carboxylmethyltransferase family protein [Caulobacteraceae bacterium]|nr:isoprenylcysteine carboxylmethyltransferase family protein [Caulobacteraceae bacterium]